MGVTGIGGFFFRAKDPDALRAWYADHLGVGSKPYGSWETQAGPSVFAPFKADTDYFPADHPWMLNLRVDDLDGLCAALAAAGIAGAPAVLDALTNLPANALIAIAQRLLADAGEAVKPTGSYNAQTEKAVGDYCTAHAIADCNPKLITRSLLGALLVGLAAN